MSRSSSRPRRSGGALWAYLNDPMPTEGPRLLQEQKETVDATAIAEGRRIRRYVIDSGSAQTEEGRGARLQAMIDEVRESGRSVTLLLAAPSHLAATREGTKTAIASLLAIGVILKDASGELHPSPSTVALAQAATMPALRRTGRNRKEIGADV